MLVLSRKAGEQIHIGDDVTIEVRRVAGNRVTVAVQAPRDVRILRGELREAVQSFEEAPSVEHPAVEATRNVTGTTETLRLSLAPAPPTAASA